MAAAWSGVGLLCPGMMEGLGAPSIGYSHEHTSTRFAAQAANRATVSATCTRSPEDLKVVLMTPETSGDSTRRVSRDIFRGIQDSFTTQGLRQLRAEMASFAASRDLNGA
jgi:hypothetical protein